MSLSFPEFLEAKGIHCPICLDIYDNDRKKPSQLPRKIPAIGCIDNLCLKCFEELKAAPICPLCKRDFEYPVGEPALDVQLSNRIDDLRERWMADQQKNSWVPQPSAPPAPSVQPPQTSVTPIRISQSIVEQQIMAAPSKPIEILDWTRHKTELDTFRVNLEALFDPIVNKMKWQKQYLMETYLENPDDWITLHLKDNDKALGFAHLLTTDQITFEVHWSGSLPPVGTYDYSWYLCSSVIKRVRELTKTYSLGEKDNVSISYLFHYDNEKEFFLDHIHYAFRLGLLDFRTIPTRYHGEPSRDKSKLTIFPWNSRFHSSEVDRILADTPAKILSCRDIHDGITSNIQKALNGTLKLNLLFPLSSFGVAEGQLLSAQLKEEFAANPENFFIYTISGEAKGYIKAERSNDTLTIRKMGTTQDAVRFRKHFLASFLVNLSAENIKHIKNVIYICPLYVKDALRDDILSVAIHKEMEIQEGGDDGYYILTIKVR